MPEPALTSTGLIDRDRASDGIRMQILAVEHWSLLATRGMTWNEMFSRASMFLTVLSAAVVALALVAQATDFGESFRAFALLILPIVLLIGLTTYIRLGDARGEDAWLVIGMNRLRHAYLELAPELAPYFITSHHDDLRGIMQTYGPDARLRPSRIISGTPILVGMINAVIVGVLGALLANALGSSTTVNAVAGVIAALVALAVLLAIPFREIARVQREYEPRFPS